MMIFFIDIEKCMRCQTNVVLAYNCVLQNTRTVNSDIKMRRTYKMLTFCFFFFLFVHRFTKKGYHLIFSIDK